jgi:hypothetical protein
VKGVHFFLLCRMIGKDIWLVGTAAINIHSINHYTCFGLECLCMIDLFYAWVLMYIINWLDFLCVLRPKSLYL